MYNITFMNTSNNIMEYYNGINNASDSLLSIIILIILWVIIFISMKHFDTKVVFLTASITTSLIGIIFVAANFITTGIVIIPLIMTMFSLFALWFSKD